MPTDSNLSAEVLRTLHRIHRQLTDLRERLARGPKQIRAREANVELKTRQVAALQAEGKAFRVATDEKQLLFKSNEAKIKELQVKLNTATSNREYQALKDQIAASEMANSVLADEILEALDRLDTYQTRIAESSAELTKTRDETERFRAEIAEKEPGIAADVARLEAELRESESALHEDVREAYQRVVRQKGEDGLAPLLDESCGGCNQQVTVNMQNNLRMGKPTFCKSCGCLLYLPE